MRRIQIALLSFILVGGTLLILSREVPDMRWASSPATIHPFRFGSKEIRSNHIGWLITPNTAYFSSYNTSQPLLHFVEASVDVVPYNIQPGTTLSLSLYLGDKLAKADSYNLDEYSRPTTATIYPSNQSDVAGFSDSTMGFGVSQLSLSTPVPAGTVVTVVLWANKPLWMEIDPFPTSNTYQTVNVTSSFILAGLPKSSELCKQTLFLNLESSP